MLIGITNFTCTDFAVAHIEGSLPTPTAIHVQLRDVHLSCAGQWNVTWIIISGNGGIVANATVSSFGMVLDLVKDEKTGLVNHSKVRRWVSLLLTVRLILVLRS